MMFVLSLAGFALLGWLSAQPWSLRRPGCAASPGAGACAPSAPHDAPALLLFMLVVPVFTVFLPALVCTASRRHEFQADAYAMAQASGARICPALLCCTRTMLNTLTPDPLFVKFHHCTPASERLRACPPTTA